MKIYLPDIVKENGALELTNLPIMENRTKFISVCGQDGSGKTNLRDNLAKYYSDLGYTVVTSKSPSDKHIVNLLNNAISQNGYSDSYTEQLLFSFCDGLISNYMQQLNGRCDYFICQRGPSDQYDHGITRSGYTYRLIHEIQKPERLTKFDIYIRLNADPKVAWERIRNDNDKDRYEYPEYFERQVLNTRKLYERIVCGSDQALNFLRESRNYYIDTTYITIEDTFKIALDMIEGELDNLKFSTGW